MISVFLTPVIAIATQQEGGGGARGDDWRGGLWKDLWASRWLCFINEMFSRSISQIGVMGARPQDEDDAVLVAGTLSGGAGEALSTPGVSAPRC